MVKSSNYSQPPFTRVNFFMFFVMLAAAFIICLYKGEYKRLQRDLRRQQQMEDHQQHQQHQHQQHVRQGQGEETKAQNNQRNQSSKVPHVLLSGPEKETVYKIEEATTSPFAGQQNEINILHSNTNYNSSSGSPTKQFSKLSTSSSSPSSSEQHIEVDLEA